jgi:DNA-binding transcriptional LysR family regulator
MIQIHRLEGFFWVAREGGYAKAARAFPYPITQPAVHQQVKKLETELSVQLFERVGKETMQLTAGGQRLYDFVKPFFVGLPAVVRSVQGGDFAGVLSIHATPLFVRRLMPAWLERLQTQRPEIEVELHEKSPPSLEALRGGEADLVIDHLPEVPDDIATMSIGTVHGFLVLPVSHAEAGPGKDNPLARLAGETFISYTKGTLAHELQRKALALHHVTPSKTISADSVEAILSLVDRGLGFSLVPWLTPDGPSGEGFQVWALSDPDVRFEVVAAWRKDTPENPLLDAVLETAPRP